MPHLFSDHRYTEGIRFSASHRRLDCYPMRERAASTASLVVGTGYRVELEAWRRRRTRTLKFWAKIRSKVFGVFYFFDPQPPS